MSQKKIVFAEDDRLVSHAYTAGLEHAGYTVIPAKDGVKALEKIKQEKPDLVLLDLMMPVKDGFAVLEELQQDKEFSEIPIIVFSNSDEAKNVERAKKLGARDFLMKVDLTVKEVVEKIKKYI